MFEIEAYLASQKPEVKSKEIILQASESEEIERPAILDFLPEVAKALGEDKEPSESFYSEDLGGLNSEQKEAESSDDDDLDSIKA